MVAAAVAWALVWVSAAVVDSSEVAAAWLASVVIVSAVVSVVVVAMVRKAEGAF